MIRKWDFRKIIIYMFVLIDPSRSRDLPDHPIANLSTTWIYNEHSTNFAFKEGVQFKAILVRPIPSRNLAYVCGFFYNLLHGGGSYFSVFLSKIHDVTMIIYKDEDSRVVWSANRNYPIQSNASLQLTSDGDLVLRNAAGELVWSTNTAGRHVAGMNLTESGNLVLFDVNNSVVWQSFDHPTDSLLPAQQLRTGHKLISSVSSANWSEGLHSFMVTNDGWFFHIGSDPPEVYYHSKRNPGLQNGSFDSSGYISVPGLNGSGDIYTRLGFDGHLKQVPLEGTWTEDIDFLDGELSNCQYPMVCGRYGVCQDGGCSCPHVGAANNSATSYFRETEIRLPNLGCTHVTPLDCHAPNLQSLVEIQQVSYFTFRAEISNIDRNACKKACLANCSCKAAMFRHGSNSVVGDCYLPSQIYSLTDISEAKLSTYNLSIYLKVQLSPNKAASRRFPLPVIIGLCVGALLALAVVCGFAGIVIKKQRWKDGLEKDDVDDMPRNTARFSFEDLKIATENFSIKLGEGGFGSVYQGSLKDGTKIAVKYLDGIGSVKNSFLREVESIGHIHHVNLVRLIGYCAEISHRMLVYEYLANGSLDKWTDDGRQKLPLDWNCRKNIVIGIARGLAYLHEGCWQKIIHLDVKPENILLDEDFNPKLSDFGLSKLLSRDQSRVVTTLRGTPGYLAPEWLSSTITEKVDVYSFGVVIMEILCGRKVFDISQPENDIHLLSLLARKAKERKLLDMVDKQSKDMQSNGAEAIKMMQVAAWCLQNEISARPSMSFVVNVLEGAADVDLSHLDYNFISPFIFEASRPQVHFIDASPKYPSVLSGPR